MAKKKEENIEEVKVEEKTKKKEIKKQKTEAKEINKDEKEKINNIIEEAKKER